jgi:hypothetical protein
MQRSLTLETHCGLGDVLVTLPFAYHFAAEGREVSIVGRGAFGPWAAQLPTLLPVGASDIGNRLSCGIDNWTRERDYWEAASVKLRLAAPIEPQFPTLRVEPSPVQGAYIAVFPRGSFPDKDFSVPMVGALCSVYRTVVLDNKTGNWPNLNLSGKTGVREMCAIVAGARAVVTCDTAGLHVAGAYQKPCVCVYGPDTINPKAFCRYAKTIWVERQPPRTCSPMFLLAALSHCLEQWGDQRRGDLCAR